MPLVRVAEDTHRELKEFCASKGFTLSNGIKELLRNKSTLELEVLECINCSYHFTYKEMKEIISIRHFQNLLKK